MTIGMVFDSVKWMFRKNLIASKQNNTEVSSKVVDALEVYLRLKGRDRDKVFHRTARRNIKYVIKNMWVRRTYSN